MSLTATLLHNAPIHLPKGRSQFHYMEGKAPPTPMHHDERGTTLENVDLVFAHINDETNTVMLIAQKTGLSKNTVLRAIRQLETDSDGPLIVRDRRTKPNTIAHA